MYVWLVYVVVITSKISVHRNSISITQTEVRRNQLHPVQIWEAKEPKACTNIISIQDEIT
jgi:hypothetical protein